MTGADDWTTINLVHMAQGAVHFSRGSMSEAERGQLLRALASDAIRGCLERYFGVRLAFQNCHRVAVFPAAEGQPGMESGAYRRFVSTREQLLNQSPELRDC